MATTIRSAFENMWFTVEVIMAMKDELDRSKSELYLVNNSLSRDWNRKIELEAAIECYTENIWPELSKSHKQ